MSITFTIANDNVDGLLDDLKRMFPTLTTGSPLPPMQEQPLENREPQPANDEKPKERKPRAKKDQSAEGEQTASAGTPASDAPASTASQTKSEGASESTESPSPGGETKAEIPDIEAVRSALKTLGAADGFGHDKVFEVLGNYKATNASSVPEGRRAELVAEIEALLKGAK